MVLCFCVHSFSWPIPLSCCFYPPFRLQLALWTKSTYLTLSSWYPSNSCPFLSGAMMMSYRFHNCNRIELLGFLQSIQSSFLDMVDCPTNCIISWLSLVQQLLPTPEVNLLPTSAKCPCSSVLSFLRTTSPFSCPQFSDAQSTCTAKAASALGTGSTFSNSTQT